MSSFSKGQFAVWFHFICRTKNCWMSQNSTWSYSTKATTKPHCDQQNASQASSSWNTVPVTPILLSMSVKVTLPVCAIDQPEWSVQLHAPLATSILTTLYEWVQSLWHEVQPHMHMDQLCNALIENQYILLVSDAAIQHNGHAMCLWIIWAGTTLWSREGHVLGIITNMYSGLAEGYGVATVLMFLQQYKLYTPPSLIAHATFISTATIKVLLIESIRWEIPLRCY